LTAVINARFGKARCFYSFLPGKNRADKLPSQIEVTDLYGYYEIEHWPGSHEHLQWTSFVFASMEYDALVEENEAEEGIPCKF
jgi:hypothetical protein